MAACADEADEPVLGAERTGKGYLEQTMERGKTQRLADVPMMKNVAKTIGKRLYGILNAMRHGVSNGNAEALNSKIRLLRIKAKGYRNRERFKLGVMFHYGKLNMAF
ncbi:putative transposase (fragment) [Escherichia coli]